PVLVSNQFTDTKDKGHSLQVMRWGLIPAFIHGDSTSTFHTFNARIESLLDKRSYKCSLQEGKRCVVVVQGSLLMLEDPGKLLMMAGLFAHNYEKQVIARCVKLVCVDVFIYHNNHKFKGHHGRCAFKNACMFHTTS
ncbi:uncharacterized protein DC041_0011113, partial [Schistosoma bovis]